MIKYLLLFMFTITYSFQMNMNWNNLPINIKSISRNWFITRAKLAGIPWDLYVDNRSDPNTIEKLVENKKNIEDENIIYPDYYTKPFHGYDYGNLEWLAAQESEPATISISTNYWKNIDPYLSEKWLRHNITSNLINYIDYHDNLRLNDLIRPKSNILDVGCSVGISTEFIKKEFENCNVEGLDLSPYFLSMAMLRNEEKDLGINYIHANAESIPKEDNYYDLITCNFLFHEVPKEDSIKILKEIKRVLAPNGILMITDLDKDILKQQLEKSKFRMWAFEMTEPHIMEYYNTDIFNLLSEIGFCFINKVKNDPINSSWLAKKWDK
jgi:ubiquinone/menaquinone biosynthesis C-methylase UbiE